MPVYRRRSGTQIAKLNATSIDGYFGTGTRCFFIRGTILSNTPVDGEYRTLQLQRPGNRIEIKTFDGVWATVAIATRSGNRHGDNLRARVQLREADLRSIGMDVERILAGFGTFDALPDEPECVPEPEIEAKPRQLQPTIDAVVAEPEPGPIVAAPEPAVAPAPSEPSKERVLFANSNASLIDGKLILEIGVSLVAIALPVVLYFLRLFFATKDER